MSGDSIKEAGSVFEQPWWLDIVAPGAWKELLVKDKNGQCIGRLPYVMSNMYGVKYCGVPKLTQHVGPWIKFDENTKTVAKLKRTKQVMEEFIKKLSAETNIDLYFHYDMQYVLPFIWVGYSVKPRFTYVIDDLSNLDNVYGGIEAKTRNLIKNVAKKVSITDDVSENELVKLIGDTYKKQNRKTPIKEDILRQVYREALKRESGKILGAVNNDTGNLIATAFFVYDKQTCYYLLGGKDYNVNVQGAQELLLWEGIRFASTVSKEFDFEGSMIQGIESFFRGFGGTPKVYYRIHRGGILFNAMHWFKPRVKKLLGYK